MPKIEKGKGERCPRCKLEEILKRKDNPDYTAKDYTEVYVYVPADPKCDHNRICQACGLTFRI